jgi:hypothetical protein
MFKSKNTLALEAARAAVADINKRLDDLNRTRAERLLAGDEAASIAKIDDEIAIAQHAAKTEIDRIILLDEEVSHEEALRVAKRKGDQIGRIEGLCGDRVKLGAKIEKKIEELLDLIEEDIEITKRIIAAWAWSNSDREVLKPFGQGIRQMLCYQFYKQSALRFLGNIGFALPGAVCERTEWQLQPQSIPSLTDRLGEIAVYASRVMRAGFNPINKEKAEAL